MASFLFDLGSADVLLQPPVPCMRQNGAMNLHCIPPQSPGRRRDHALHRLASILFAASAVAASALPSPAQAHSRNRTPRALDTSDIDPGLGVPPDSIDMVIGEVKEGRVGINNGARDPEILKTVIARLGDSNVDSDAVVADLLEHGSATLTSGFTIRLIAFGSFPPGAAVPPCRIISLGHVLDFLQRYVRKHWNMLRHLQFKDHAFGFLMTLEKARRGGAGRRGEAGVEIVSAKPRPPHARGQRR